MFLILSVSEWREGKRIAAGSAVGGVIAFEAIFAGPICGASMNPARSIAPAIVSGHAENLWVYIWGPVLGAVLVGAAVSVAGSESDLEFVAAKCTAQKNLGVSQ